MTGPITNLFMALLYAWAATGLATMVLPLFAAFGLGAAIGIGLGLIFPRNPLSLGLVALLDPIGVVLPLLALRQMAGWAGVDVPAFATTEILLFLVAYVLFLAAATGKLRFDPYRLGYAPLPAGLIALALIGLGIAQGSLLLPILAVAAQTLWLTRSGSSNYFDHILHAVLVPVAVIELLSRAVGA